MVYSVTVFNKLQINSFEYGDHVEIKGIYNTILYSGKNLQGKLNNVDDIAIINNDNIEQVSADINDDQSFVLDKYI